jgi:membrane associated rhomboid family serine protease
VETCYRHPTRETGVSCSNCGRAICPDCMTPTPVGMRCPECSRQRTPVKTMTSVRSGTQPTVTITLIAINVIAFVAELASGSGVGSSSASRVVDAGALNGLKIAQDHEYWRLITGGFLHAGVLHILFNMYLLYVLGGLLEPAIGKLRFTALYFTSLLAGSLGVIVAGAIAPDIGGWLGDKLGYLGQDTVGASGAVFGLMGAAVVAMRARGINPMESGIGWLIVINLGITFVIPGISVGGHIGGLIGGVVAGWLIFDVGERRRAAEVIGLAACAVLSVGAVIGSIAVATGAV